MNLTVHLFQVVARFPLVNISYIKVFSSARPAPAMLAEEVTQVCTGVLWGSLSTGDPFIPDVAIAPNLRGQLLIANLKPTGLFLAHLGS